MESVMSKPKPVNWELIDNQSSEANDPYKLLDNIKNKYHSGPNKLNDLNIVLMWRHNVRPDQDGYILIADISKSSDKMRELRPHDVIIGINKAAWRLLSDDQKQVVLDTQLERVVICMDQADNPKEDDRSRLIYRLRRVEVLDDQTMKRRYNMTMSDVHEYVFNRLKGDFAKNSYVDKIINGANDDTE